MSGREVVDVDENIAEIFDPVCGENLEFTYRLPTNQERVKYQGMITNRKGNVVVTKEYSTQLKGGGWIITGYKKIKEGNKKVWPFSAKGKPFSSDPTDPSFRPDWKALLTKGAPELVAAVGKIAFTGGVDAKTTQGVEIRPETAEELEESLGDFSDHADAPPTEHPVPGADDEMAEGAEELDAPLET